MLDKTKIVAFICTREELETTGLITLLASTLNNIYLLTSSRVNWAYETTCCSPMYAIGQDTTYFVAATIVYMGW